jgi:hypothetical protein
MTAAAGYERRRTWRFAASKLIAQPQGVTSAAPFPCATHILTCANSERAKGIEPS